MWKMAHPENQITAHPAISKRLVFTTQAIIGAMLAFSTNRFGRLLFDLHDGELLHGLGYFCSGLFA